jgi:transposase InsO family protein
MRMLNIYSKRKNKFKTTTDSNHSHRIFPNLLNRQFNKRFKNGAWVSDITYIQTIEGFIYQTVIIDLSDRKVIGWSHSNGMSTAETTIQAFNMAVKNRTPKKGLLFHSDRGVQYACDEFVNLLKNHQVRQSMSRKGNCWDNAVAESYFKTLKSELIYGNRLVSRDEMKLKLFNYVEVYYNQKRRHSALGNMTIKEFEEKKNKYKKRA